MPTEDRTAISVKVRTDEKALFEQLCKTEGLTPSQPIRSFILACNEQGAISDHDARYKERYNIQPMR